MLLLSQSSRIRCDRLVDLHLQLLIVVTVIFIGNRELVFIVIGDGQLGRAS